ncbi:hypothetical protein [Mesomycoplasma ovipneumoniae]|uniref:hypothetical protein n=1 Tax=Mesomycoplasma ovipneumoniae TaxID=29562 RepID=UPI00311B200E
MKYSFIKSNKFKIFSSGLMLTTLASPLLFTSVAPIQQKQIAPEIKIQSNEFSNTEILKNNLIEYVFENDKNNIDSIKFELNKLAKSNKLNDLSEKDLNKFAENLISFTKDHFNNKEVLEEAWYHWFPMMFWYTAYTLTIGSNAGLSLLGELFNHPAIIVDSAEIGLNILFGKYDAAAIKTFVLITKLLSSMYTNEKNNIGNLITDTTIDSIADFITNKDPKAMLEDFLKNLSISILDNAIKPLIQKSIKQLREGISFQKVKIWAKYIYYYKLYWG